MKAEKAWLGRDLENQRGYLKEPWVELEDYRRQAESVCRAWS